MGMDTAKAFQTPLTRSIFLQIREDNTLMVPHHDIDVAALPVDQHPDLTADFKGQSANGLCEFRRDDKSRWGSPTIEIG
jgi:hypothetical protein